MKNHRPRKAKSIIGTQKDRSTADNVHNSALPTGKVCAIEPSPQTAVPFVKCDKQTQKPLTGFQGPVTWGRLEAAPRRICAMTIWA